MTIVVKPKHKPIEVNYYQYKKVVETCKSKRFNEITFFLDPGDEHFAEACFCSISHTRDHSESISMPVNPIIARNLVNLIRGFPVPDISKWKSFELGIVDYPESFNASSDIIQLLFYLKNMMGKRKNPLMWIEDDYYHYRWTDYEIHYPHEMRYWIEVLIKKTIENTINLKNQGIFAYDSDSLKLND